MDVDNISAGGISTDAVFLGKRSSNSNMTEFVDSTNSVGMYVYMCNYIDTTQRQLVHHLLANFPQTTHYTTVQ